MRSGAQVVGSTHQSAGRLSAGLGRGPLREPLGDVRRVARQCGAGRSGAQVVDISPPVNRAEWWVGRGP